MYPGKKFFNLDFFFPSLISKTFSDGISTFEIFSCNPMRAISVSKYVLTFASCPEYVRNTYQRLSKVHPPRLKNCFENFLHRKIHNP